MPNTYAPSPVHNARSKLLRDSTVPANRNMPLTSTILCGGWLPRGEGRPNARHRRHALARQRHKHLAPIVKTGARDRSRSRRTVEAEVLGADEHVHRVLERGILAHWCAKSSMRLHQPLKRLSLQLPSCQPGHIEERGEESISSRVVLGAQALGRCSGKRC